MDLSFCSNTQSEAVMSAHGEISQESMPKWENVRCEYTYIVIN